MAGSADGVDPESAAQRRRWAMWNLGKLGDNVSRFDKLKPEQQDAIIAALSEQAANPNTARSEWATEARNYLRGPQAHSLQALGLEKHFLAAATDNDPFLRQLTALALSFWEGTPQESERIDDVLLRLAHDDGHGEETMRAKEDQSAEGKAITKTPGLRTRFNAVLALAHRGSAKTRLGVVKEMLDEQFLRDNFLVEGPRGAQKPDDAMISQTIEAALKALVQLHARQPKLDLSSFNPALDTLTKNGNIAVRTEAARVKEAMSK
jgi:hypothetical protein